jgi:hypothetical protein
MPDIGTTQNSQICVRSSDGDNNDLARPYRFLFVHGVKSFGEGSGFAAAVSGGVVTCRAR